MTMLWLNMEESTGEAGIVVFTRARIALRGQNKEHGFGEELEMTT